MRGLALILCLSIAITPWCGAADDTLPLDHWVYSELAQLAASGLLPHFPAAWINDGHPLTRHECAYYVREAILRLSKMEAVHDSLETRAETALGRLVEEFHPELRALGVNVEPWTNDHDSPVYLDLDSLLASITQRPEVPPAEPPPGSPSGGGDPSLSAPSPPPMALTEDGTYRINPVDPLRIPLTDFRNYPSNLVRLAGEVLGTEWQVAPEDYRNVLGMPLHIGGFVISGEQRATEQTSLQSGVGLTFGEQTGLGFNALLYLDLDQAQIAMNALLLDVSTQVELNERLGLFGGLSLEYQIAPVLLQETGSQATAGLRYLVNEDLYLIAGYSLTNPLAPEQPHPHGPTVGLSLGDIGLILLGFRTTNVSNLESLQLSGLFIYRY